MQLLQADPKTEGADTAVRVGVHFMRDLEKAMVFYRDIMGFSLKDRCEKSLVFQAENLDLYIVEAGPRDPANTPGGFGGPSELLRYLERSGCEVDSRGDGTFYFNDPNGAMDALMRYTLPDPCLHN